MRLSSLSIPMLTLALAGCAAFAPLPDPAQPHATVTDSHVDINAAIDRVDTFRVLEVNGRRVLDLSDQPARKIGHDFSNIVPSGQPVRLEVEGFTFYNNTVRRMFWDPMHVGGVIEFVPNADARYVLRGTVAPESSSIWLEDAATHAVVGNRLTQAGHGTAAPAPDDAASAGSTTLRSGGA